MLTNLLYFPVVLTISKFYSADAWVLTEIDLTDLKVRNFAIESYDENFLKDLEQKKFSLIFPGTKWCGPGNIAKDYNDLGTARETDMCCREHDFCSDIIPGGKTKYNLTNKVFYTRLNCECDRTFRKCLRAASEITAMQIGFIYFDLLGTQCFQYEYPIISCKERSEWLHRKCLVYELDMLGEPLYQWFDVPNL